MSSLIQVVAGIAAATYVLLVALLRFTQDGKEPTSISDTIPFITPIINMTLKGGEFHRQMRDKYNLPIYTLRLPGSRMYIVNSASLITAIQAQFRALSFTAIEANIAANLLGCKKETIDIIGRDVNKDHGYLMSFPKENGYSHPAGPALDAMNRRAIQVIAESLDAWAQKKTTEIQLWQWVRHELLMASTEGVYGPKNPFRDPEMEKAWYTIMMPSKVQHTNREVWGDTVDTFNHERFVPGGKRVNPVAFRGFGGGTTLCPGRHFASTEILMFSALLVLRFDLKPADGKWIKPTTANSSLVNAMPVPDSDINIQLRPRSENTWRVSFSGYDKGMEIAAEDVDDAVSSGGH
ncbi:hypothetical protein KVR01_004125 [Diaporthe batatas]|uniref:uncharacterized protein n=1 Tax=Diaporthe batatas TaxID=748121 RepID=UPI001D05170E|nr:uncharacterized protein KVR01_004125 [Diaporthe batatas]KAG8165573.1 hypothetical protein KVR01_004125 [Diaporthe batatas]